MDFSTVPASNYPLPELVEFLNRGFEGYFVPVQFTLPTFLTMLRKDGVDLAASCVLIQADQPCGIAFIARRGWTSRLAAMGISKDERHKGAGSWLMKELLRQARRRGDREMVLEVIEQNEAAVRLYHRHDFQTVRRLVGLTRKGAEENEQGELPEVDLRQISHLVSKHGIADLPWQLSAESIAQMNPPARGYRYERAYIAVSNPDAEQVAIWSLLVEPEARGKGQGTALLRNVMAHYPGRTWHIPAVFPEEMTGVFEGAGFERGEISQWQMRLPL